MYYHGTTKGNADIIVKTQLMKPSIGDEQWLGDGCYFYVDAEYAFRWILIKYTNNFRNEFSADYSNIYGEYTIVSAEINVDEERVFSMENIKNRLLFIKVKTEISKKTAQSDRYRGSMRNNSVVDGVVFNYLFNYEGYGKKYDAVKAVFPISYIYDDSRMEYLPEPQICVKNVEIISDYKIFSTETVPEEYSEFIKTYNDAKYALKKKKIDLAKYKVKPKNIKYKKEEMTHYDRN